MVLLRVGQRWEHTEWAAQTDVALVAVVPALIMPVAAAGVVVFGLDVRGPPRAARHARARVLVADVWVAVPSARTTRKIARSFEFQNLLAQN